MDKTEPRAMFSNPATDCEASGEYTTGEFREQIAITSRAALGKEVEEDGNKQ